MIGTEDYVLALLFTRLQRLPADKLRACIQVADARGIPLADAVAEARTIAADEVRGFVEAARFLRAGDHLRACAKCFVQAVEPARPDRKCRGCGAGMGVGVVASPRAIEFDPGLERQVRRIILDASSRVRTGERVTKVRRRVDEGKVRARPEGELAPQQRAVAEAVLGPYQLVRLIGRGEVAYVYQAIDSRTGGTVALKVLYFKEGETQAVIADKVGRFRREAELASKLDHTNLVRVGQLEQTGPWYHIAMSYVDGPNLAQVLGTEDPAARPEPRALQQALCEVARALHYAHCRGVIHRDVSPRCILFSTSGQVFLGDFGVAKPVEGGLRLSGTEGVVGQREYAAPERLESETNASPKSDVYSLGVVLHLIVTGQMPGALRPSKINPEVTSAMEALIRRATHQDPDRRLATAAEFAERLERLCSEAPETEAPPSLVRRVARLAFAFALGCALAVALAPPPPITAEEVLAPVGPAFAKLGAASFPDAWTKARDGFRVTLADAERLVPKGRVELDAWQGRFAWSQGDAAGADAFLARSADPADRVRHALAALVLGTRRSDPKRLEAASTELAAAAKAAPPGLEPGEASAWAALAGMSDPAGKALLVESSRFGGWAWARDPSRADVAALTAQLERRPGDVWVHAMLARALDAAGKDKEALAAAHAGQGLFPGVPELWVAEARVLLRRGDFLKAQEVLRRALALDAVAPEAHRLLGQAMAGVKDWCSSAAEHGRAFALDPQSGADLFLRAEAYRAHGKQEPAASDYGDYLRDFPDGPHAAEAKLRLGR